ncbi:hypothetical protein BB558_003438 [Smittium angustum]|uniref:Tetra-spanning protein 1 n=1 Tax=Smittium angustum TaxID=133377 RepID=A0A2U1J630_SMIAN|nr:hypothetical protein BB558_003438 [Smittium angustum]
MATQGIPSTQPLSAKLIQVAKTAQFSWWIGHVLTLFFGSLYFMKFMFSPSSAKYYSFAYIGAIISYGISIYKTYGPPQFSLPFLQRLIVDENVQYVILAIYFYTQSPIFVSLIPYFIFSFFHASSYLRLTIIPLVFPQVTSELEKARAAGQTSVPLSLPSKVSQFLGTSIGNYYSTALKIVSTWEIAAIMPWLTLTALTFQASFIAPIIYAQFLRIRYTTSPPTRAAFHTVRVFLDGKLTPPTASASIPPVVTKYYTIARDYIVAIGNQLTNQTPAPN